MQEKIDELLRCAICLEFFRLKAEIKFKPKNFQKYFRHPLMLPCQHQFCIVCLKTLFDIDSLICPCCRRPIDVKFSNLERPRAILNTMNIFERGVTDIKPKELEKIYESARLVEQRNKLSREIPQGCSHSSRWFMDWSICYYTYIIFSYYFN